MFRQIYLDAPNVGELEKEYLNSAIDNGYVSSVGPLVSEFETEFAGYLGVERAISIQSGTSAIHIALYELGIGPGDEVIVPALTFIATVNPILYVGARPVFVDVDRDTWNIDPGRIEKKITGKTKAILPVHLYGNPCAMDEIVSIASKKNIRVIEDATESLGAEYRSRQTGTFGDFGCFSFNGNKIITTGGGGMVVGKDPERLKHIKFLVNQAREESKEYYHPEIGFNSRMTNIEAALGLAQIKRLGGFLQKKRRFNAIYREELKDARGVRFQKEYPGSKSSAWLTCVTLNEGVDIAGLREKLRERGIPTRRVFAPVVEFPPYHGHKNGDYENSYHVYERGLCLPASTLNSEDDIRSVCETMNSLLSTAGDTVKR